jgi:hypothetical protein
VIADAEPFLEQCVKLAMLGENIKILMKPAKWERCVKPLIEKSDRASYRHKLSTAVSSWLTAVSNWPHEPKGQLFCSAVAWTFIVVCIMRFLSS